MSFHDALTVIGALAIVIIMIMVIRLGGQGAGPRRLLAARTSDTISIEAALQLDTRRRLSLIVCDGQRALILTGGPADMMLGWLPPACRPTAIPQTGPAER